jgi:hypothetical protein
MENEIVAVANLKRRTERVLIKNWNVTAGSSLRHQFAGIDPVSIGGIHHIPYEYSAEEQCHSCTFDICREYAAVARGQAKIACYSQLRAISRSERLNSFGS